MKPSSPIYKTQKLSPEVIDLLHSGEYFIIDQDNHKQIFSDFVLKKHPEKYSQATILQEADASDDIQQRMLEIVVMTVALNNGQQPQAIIDILKDSFYLIKK